MRRSLPRGRRYIQLLRSRDWDGKDLKKNFNIITDFLKTYIIPILASVVSAFSILPQVWVPLSYLGTQGTPAGQGFGEQGSVEEQKRPLPIIPTNDKK